MRTIAATILFFVFGQGLLAQQKPQYSQYYQNLAVLNPAATGKENSVSIRAGFRNQWVGFEGAPKTSYLTLGTPINIGNTQSGFVDYGVSEPGTRSDREDYISSYSHHGL